MMWYEDMFSEVESLEDKEQAEKMSAYMQDKFRFLGIPKAKLSELIKPYMKKVPRTDRIDWDFVNLCWEKDYREAQYIGIEYLKRNKKWLTEADFDSLKRLITTKSWWETVDNIDGLVGMLALKYPSVKNEMLALSLSDNIWLRRIAIDYQQGYKEQTDAGILEKIICNNLGTDEFYIDKAIGWSLREYSKVNPEWVREFVQRYKEKLSKLSIREASKYL